MGVLLHVHRISIVSRESKVTLMEPECVNAFKSADIPSSQIHVLRDIMLERNIHQSCVYLNPTSVCMGEGHCWKQLPKEFMEKMGQGDG